MSDTPRTDAIIHSLAPGDKHTHLIGLARQLERELARSETGRNEILEEAAEECLKIWRAASNWPDSLQNRISHGCVASAAAIRALKNVPAVAPPQEGALRNQVIEECALVCDGMNGIQFALVGKATTEEAKHKHGAKVAMAMECAAAIRAIKVPTGGERPRE